MALSPPWRIVGSPSNGDGSAVPSEWGIGGGGRHRMAAPRARWHHPLEGLLLAALPLGLYLSRLILPFPGAALSVLTPVPLILLRLRWGRGWTLCALSILGGGLAITSGPEVAMAFALEFGLPAFILGECLAAEVRAEVAFASGGLAAAAGGFLLLSYGSSGGSGGGVLAAPFDALLREVQGFVAQQPLQPGQGRDLVAIIERLRPVLMPVLPGFLVAFGLLGAALQAFLARWAEQRLRSETAAGRSLAVQLPEPLVWGLIAAGLLYLSGRPVLRPVGLNLLLICAVLYFLQGLSIVTLLLRRFRLPSSLVGLSVALVFLHPLFVLLVAAVGLFDVWFAFRRLELPRGGDRP